MYFYIYVCIVNVYTYSTYKRVVYTRRRVGQTVIEGVTVVTSDGTVLEVCHVPDATVRHNPRVSSTLPVGVPCKLAGVSCTQ